PSPDSRRPLQVAVYVAQIGGPSGIETNILAGVTSENIVDRLMKNQWPYFMATNSFCGPIELHDAAGRVLPLLKPAVSWSAAYPADYGLEAVNSNYFRQFQFYLGARIFPVPLL